MTIKAGQTVAFVGENGSGKSTLAAVIARLRTPDSGVFGTLVHLLGVPVQRTIDTYDSLFRAATAGG